MDLSILKISVIHFYPAKFEFRLILQLVLLHFKSS